MPPAIKRHPGMNLPSVLDMSNEHVGCVVVFWHMLFEPHL